MNKQIYDERENSGTLQLVAMDLHKSYRKGKLIVPVLKGVNLGVREGEMLAIVGQSGSGKSTLLHLLGTLDAPDSGSIHFDGQRIDSLSGGRRDLLRNQFIGMIFQFYHLIPELTTIENVLAPIMIRESVWGYLSKRSQYRKKAAELLDRVGLSHRIRHKPNELSGGEMQRAAIARALISDPQILLADEPTGNLDLNSAKEVLQLLRDLNREKNVTIVMVTHDLSIAQQANRIIRLVDGCVIR
jgi:lipoprotein-releasing system ATP-binding protein